MKDWWLSVEFSSPMLRPSAEIAGAPSEETVDEQEFTETDIALQEQSNAPVLSEENGSPQQEFSSSNQVNIAENIIAPTESSSLGIPIQTDIEDIQSESEEGKVEITENAPEQSDF